MKNHILIVLGFVLAANIALAAENSKSNEFRKEENWKALYPFSQTGCANNDASSCKELVSVGEKAGVPRKQLHNFLSENCEKGISHACVAKIDLMHEEENHEEALAFEREKIKVMPAFIFRDYPIHEYRWGEKTLAYEAVVTICKSEGSYCQEYIELMPSHPQREELIQYATNYCYSDYSGRLSSCSRFGGILWRLERREAANEIWHYACESGDGLACVIYLHANRENPLRREFSMNHFCSVSEEEFSETCAQFRKDKSISVHLEEYGKRHIKENYYAIQ